MFERGEILVKIGIIGALTTLIGGYTLFELQSVIEGPVVEVASPKNGATMSDSLIDVSGIAENVASISLNGRPIFIDERGSFGEQLLLSYGHNIITIEATDRFGRAVEKKLEVVYK